MIWLALIAAALGGVYYMAERDRDAAERPRWAPPPQYARLIADASDAAGLPDGLLARLIWQESRYDPDAVSPAGAQGIAQIVPRWHPGVDPYDPLQAIPYAAAYLRRLFDRFGRWDYALAAYNAGPTRVAEHGGIPPIPETLAYVREITADVPHIVEV